MLAHDLIKFVFLAGFSCLFACMGWANSAPTDINASNLTIAENSAIGTVVGEFNATDPDGDTNITFSLVPPMPSDLNLSLWLDASDASTITHSNGSVSQWADKSGNGNHAVQATSNNRPILASDGLGGKSVIQFDGINDYITSSDLNITQSYSIFLVAKTNNNANGREYLFDGVGDITSHRSLIALDNAGKIQMWAGSWANSNFDTPAEAFVISAIFDDSNSSLSLNGTSVTGLNVSSRSLNHGIRIGANHLANNDFLDGCIAEFIIVDESVSTVSQAAVEAYLAYKWGLQNDSQSFSMDSNGTLTSKKSFDYETEDHNYSITVFATDDHNATFDKNFTITVTNVVEDLDGDGIEDHNDDDIDGDGLTNAEELAYNSDPWDANSGNRPPSDINASNLTIAENSAVGTVIGEFNATDPDGEGNFSFSLPDANAFYSVETNGTLKVSGLIDYETYDSNFSFIVRVLDDRNASFDKNFTITVTNVVEDLDGDGTEDYYDDDIDGDGLTNAEELAYNSDPWDVNSSNRPPSDINASNLTIAENSAIGTVIGEFNATDPDGEGNFSYSLVPTLPEDLNLSLWLDASDASTITHSNGSVSQWADKSGNGNHAVQATSNNMPTLASNGLGGKSVIQFDGINDYITSSDLNITQSYTIFLVAKTNNNANGREYLFDGVGDITSHRSLIALDNAGKIQMWAGSWANSNFDTPAEAFVISGIFDDSNSSLSLNGTSVTGLNVSSRSLNHGIRIGANHLANNDFLDGNIAEFMIVDESVSTVSQAAVEAYLAYKWGLKSNLAIDHPYNSLFSIESNGTLTANHTLDYETDDRNYSITVRATDDHNISFDKNFTITVSNVVEDLDGDGIEDHNDTDIDGDGLTNAEELAYNSDPWDASSSNRPPSDINASNLTIAENSAVGTVIGEFNATDPDGEGNFSYEILDSFLSESSPSLWLDAHMVDGSSYLETLTDDTFSNWIDLSGNSKNLRIINSSNAFRRVELAGTQKQYVSLSNNGLVTDESISVRSVLVLHKSTTTGYFLDFRSGVNESYIYGPSVGSFWVSYRKNGITQSTVSQSNILNNQLQISYLVGSQSGSGKFNLNSRFSNNEFGSSLIGEVLIFDRVLSSEEIIKGEQYLSHKWDLNYLFPSNHFDGLDLFILDENGTISANQTFDYETDDLNYSITVRVTDDHNVSFDKNFTITVTNVVEDLDGDGIEDHNDTDIDGDGLTNAEELAYNSDPWDASSSNRPPSDINASNLTIAENSAIGTIIGEFNATDPDGDGNFTFSLVPPLPSDLNLSLWLDASSLTSAESFWEDLSGSGNNAEKHGSPTVIPNAQNGMSLMRYSGASNEYHSFSRLTDIRTVFWVTSRTGMDGESRFLLGDSTSFNFHSDGRIFWHSSVNAAQVTRSGTTRLNGIVINGQTTNMPSDLAVISLKTTGNVSASSFSKDRHINVRNWKGDLGELMIFNYPLADSTIQQVEGYLAHKWGLGANLPSSHPFKNDSSLFSLDTNGTLTAKQTFDFETDDLNYTITVWAADDHNVSFDKNFTITVTNVVEDLDGDGTEDHYDLDDDGDGLSDLDEAHFNSDPRDANSPTVPATSFVISQELSISEDAEIGSVVGKFTELEASASPMKSYELIPHLPTSVNPVLWLDASELDYAGETWQDKSLSNNHATRNGSAQGFPTILKNFQNGHSVMHYSGHKENYHRFNEINDIRTVFWVVGRSSGFMLGHKTSHNFHVWNAGIFAGNGWVPASIREGDLFLKGEEVDGSSTWIPASLSIVSLRTTGNVKADNFSKDRGGATFRGELAELLIYDQALSDLQLKEVEQYLSLKWALPLKYPNAEFSIDDNGTVRTLAKSDYEIGSERKILVRATNENNQSLEHLFSVSITNAFDDVDKDGITDASDDDIDGDGLSNEYEEEHGFDPYDPLSKNYAPTDIVPSSSLSVSEKAKVGTNITTLSVSDSDAGAEHEFYLATGAGDAGNEVFNLSDTGNLKLAKVLNYDLATEYSIRVRVIDEHNASFEKVLSVSVINVMEDIDGDGIEDQFDSDDDGDGIPDESDPDRDGDGLSNAEEITNGSNPLDPNSVNYPASSISSVDGLKIVENSAIGSLVGQLLAIDPDDGASHQYELVETNSYPANELFTLSGEGYLRTKTIFNYEANSSSYEIRVKASDEYNASSVHTLTVELVDDIMISPYSLNINTMLWLDATDSSLMDTGFELADNIPSNGQKVGFWKDKSGRGYDAISKNHLNYDGRLPVYRSSGFNDQNLPYMHFTNDCMIVEGSEETFDSWSELSVFAVLKTSLSAWDVNFGKIINNFENSWSFYSDRADLIPPQFAFNVGGTSANDTLNLHTEILNDFGVLHLKLGGGKRQVYFNGQQLGSFTDSGSITALKDTPVTIGSDAKLLQPSTNLKLGEFLIFNQLLTESNRHKLEGYLGHKWNFIHEFPATHPHHKIFPVDQSFVMAENMSVGSSLGTLSSTIANYDSNLDYSLAESNSTNDNQYFTLSSTGILKNAQLFDYESNQSKYTIGFVAKNSDGVVVSTINQTVYLINEVEDFDEDGVEDAYDPDDDDDGFSDITEIAYGSNPKDDQSVANASPTDISSPVSLSINENASIGVEVGSLIVSDDDANDSYRFDILYPYPEGLSPAIWYDPTDSTKVTVSSGVVTSVQDKSANGYTLSKIGDPTLDQYLGKNVFDLDGDDLLFTSKDWKRTGEFTFFAVARYSGDLKRRVISDRDSDSNWLFGLNSGGMGKYHFNGWLNHGTSGDEKFHLLVADMNSFDQGNTWLDGKKTLENGKGAGSKYEPVRLQFGGWRNNSEMSNCQIAEFVGFNSVLPPDQNAEVQAYLSSKWAVGSVNIEDTSYRFSLDNNGTLVSNMSFDYEDDQNHTIRVRVIDQGDEFIEKDFVVSITDVLEDLDGDGVEDHLDTDVDGDGASDSLEIAGRSDPLDENSTNQQPNGLTATESLTLSESTSLGMEINRFTGNDPDSDTNFSYSLVSRLDGLKPVLWLDATNEDSIKHVGGDVYEWKDLSENGYNVYQPESDRRPSSWNSSHINELNVISFNRSHSDYLYTQKPLRANWQDIYVVGKWTGGGSSFPNYSGLVSTLYPPSHWSSDVGLVANQSKTSLYTSGKWWDNLYLNGQSSDGSNVFSKMASPFIASIGSNENVSLTGLSLGHDRPFAYTNRAWDGFIGEVIVFDRKLNTAERQTAENYLAAKWGIAVGRSVVPLSNDLFKLDENGSLELVESLDFEESDKHLIRVRVTDDWNASFEKEFQITVTDVFEDADSDGTQDHLDDDADGDGISNIVEIEVGTDPLDANSKNHAPNNISATTSLTVAEDLEIGAEVSAFTASDPDAGQSHRFTLVPSEKIHLSPQFWLDANKSSSIDLNGSKIMNWSDARNGRKMIQDESEKQPYLNNRELNDMQVVEFGGNSFLYSYGSFDLYENASIFMVAGIDGVDHTNDSIISYNSSSSGSKFQLEAGSSEGFLARLNSSGAFGQDKTFLNSAEHEPSLYEIIFNNSNGSIEVLVDGESFGHSSYKNPLNGRHVLRLFANRGLDVFASGFVAEFMVFEEALSEVDRKLVESYLGEKWALPMHDPIEHPLFKMEQNGTLVTREELDFETDENHTITVRVFDEYNATYDKDFLVSVTNVVEDLDGDGIENHYDTDDDNDSIPDELDPDDDNDGFSDADELAYGSDPLDPNSVPNSAPVDLNASNVLTIYENQPVSTSIGEFNATDPDGDNITYHFVSGDNNNSFFTLDTNGTLKSGVSFDYESNASTYTITVQAKDELNASVEGNFTVTLLNVDDEKPVIELAGDSNITHEAGSFYTDQNATWADNVDGDGNLSGTGEVNASNPGIYYLTFNYTDDAGNVAQTVTRTVNVVDRTAPVITLNGDSNITHEAGTAYHDANATWMDAVDGEGIIYGVGDVNVSKPGIYYLAFDYTDQAGNAAGTVTRTVNVLDRIAPEISLNGENEITHEAGTAYEDANATWTDAVDGSGIIHAQGEVDTNKPGTYILNYNYTDDAGNAAATVTRIINVVDRIAPLISLNGDSNITHEAGTAYEDANATWTDAVDGSGIIHAEGEVDTTKPGTYILSYNYIDEAGNAAQTVTRSINVVDRTAPVITLRGAASVSQLVGRDFTDAGATWYDVVDGEGEAQVTGEVLSDILGTYELIYSHTDQAGNHAVKVKRIVRVVNTPPTELVSQSPLSVLENQPAGTLVGSFTSQSDNINSRLVYRLVEGDTSKDSVFTLDENGTLRTATVFDFETDAKQYEIEVEVADQFGASQSKSFTVDLVNIVEDLDGDGTEDFYDDDIDGDGFTNQTELAEGTNPRDPFSASMQPILKTISGYLDRNGSIILRGRVEADGDGKVTDFGFVLSSKAVMSRSAGKDIWIRGVGNASSFTLQVDENPFDGDLYFRAWAKNLAGYGVGSVKKVVFEMEPSGLWGQTEEFDGGWQVSPWFGAFRAYEEGWLYHARLGWLYSKEAQEQSVWLWQENRGWLWTQEEIWPYLWSNRSSDWIYLFPSKAGEPIYLFDQATGTAEPLR